MCVRIALHSKSLCVSSNVGARRVSSLFFEIRCTRNRFRFLLVYLGPESLHVSSSFVALNISICFRLFVVHSGSLSSPLSFFALRLVFRFVLKFLTLRISVGFIELRCTPTFFLAPIDFWFLIIYLHSESLEISLNLFVRRVSSFLLNFAALRNTSFLLQFRCTSNLVLVPCISSHSESPMFREMSLHSDSLAVSSNFGALRISSLLVECRCAQNLIRCICVSLQS